MRVALVTHQFPSREHPYISDWASALQRAGIDLLVLAESKSENTGGKRESLNVKVFNQLNTSVFFQRENIQRLPTVVCSPSRWMNAIRILANAEEKPRTIARKLFEYLPFLNEQADLVHFNAPQIAVRRFELGKIFNAPVIVSFRGQDMTLHPQRYDRILLQADHLHFISRHLIDEAYRRGYPGGKHTLIPPAIDTTFYKPAQLPAHRIKPSTYKIFTAARLEWVKGFEYAVHSVAILAHKGWDVQYYIAGDGSMLDAIAYAARQLDVEDRVYFLGWLKPDEVRNHMQSADLYLLTSVQEGFNNSVVQAQACGLPVVCSDVGGLSENIRDGETGLLAKCRDPWDVAEKMERVLQEIPLQQRLAKAARQNAVEHFDLNKNITQYVAMYRRVLRKLELT